LQPVRHEPLAEDELADLEDGEESECSDSLWQDYRKHCKDAISLEEYCRRRGIKLDAQCR
jgi:hypothetical protein